MGTKKAKKPRYVRTDIALTDGKISLYAGTKVRDAIREVTQDMSLYHGVRFAEILEVVYEQGQKDGRKEMIEKIEGLKKGVNYLPPGRPKKSKKK